PLRRARGPPRPRPPRPRPRRPRRPCPRRRPTTRRPGRPPDLATGDPLMADADAVRGAGPPELAPAPPPAATPGTAMTLVDHLSELRSRLIKSVLTIVAGSAIGFV